MAYEPASLHGFPIADGHLDGDRHVWESSGPTKVIEASRFRWVQPETIPPRRWLYGQHYIRKFVSATIAPGGVGKSAIGIVEALSICAGRQLLGVVPDERANVWIWNGEDPLEEMQRRIIAACRHYGIDESEIAGRLFVDSGRETEIIIARQSRSSVEVLTATVEQIEKTIRKNEIGVMIVDPFVSSHRVSENDNGAIDLVVKTWGKIADRTGCSIELVHHSRKTGGASVTVEDGRGAVALLGAARSARVLNSMTQDEAEKAEVEHRRRYFRVENGKANLVPAVDKAIWFRFESTSLDNGADGAPGDSVGVVRQWSWPDALKEVTVADLRAVQTAIAAGRYREHPQARDWVGKAIAEVLSLDIGTKAHRARIMSMIRIWCGSKALMVVEEPDENREIRRFIKVGEWAND